MKLEHAIIWLRTQMHAIQSEWLHAESYNHMVEQAIACYSKHMVACTLVFERMIADTVSHSYAYNYNLHAIICSHVIEHGILQSYGHVLLHAMIWLQNAHLILPELNNEHAIK